MTAVLYEGCDGSYFLINSGDKRFKNKYGGYYETPKDKLYKTLSEMSAWANNTLKEEFLIEIE